ncbi:multinuclear nonheme iron-dependent oxidase [Tsukamurella ocularis]|uniref:multinuclear nonheme iron-dependent oxidase n=1 Tax=Tsukamurella ocularis TaxID=1970234 RepID=UPI0039F0666F
MAISGVSAAWRPELAGMLLDGARSGSVAFTEVVAENVDPADPPAELAELARSGVTVVPHGVTLGIAGADLPDAGRLRRLADLALAFEAPLVSEHVAFVRAGTVGLDDGAAAGPHDDVLEAGHLMPAPRTAEALDVLVENVWAAQAALPVPLALENIAALFAWPEDGYDEPAYLRELVERTGVRLVLDLANVYASCTARGTDAAAELRRYPLEAVAYVHIAGGRFDGDLYLDTHADPICPEVLDLLAVWRDSQRSLGGVAAGGGTLPGVLLERDESVIESAVRHEMLCLREVLGID